MYLAYKYVGLAVLLAEANFNAEKLNLPMPRPIQQNQLTYRDLNAPRLMRSMGIGGRIDAGGYSFTEGHRRIVMKLHPFGRLSADDENELLSREKSLISTNEAYQLAAGWLRAIDVDLQKLEKTSRCEVRQRSFVSEKAAAEVLLPIFYVRWGKWEEPKVDVSIDGRTKQLIDLRQEDISFSRRPAQLLRYVDELLAIPDEEFRNYTAIQGSNLVARFAMNWPVLRPTPRYLAYKYVGLAALLAEVNFNAERLNLPIPRPVQEKQLTFKRVLDPAFYRNFGGQLDAGGYSFSERDRSPARMVTKQDPFRQKPGEEDLLTAKPLISTNEAYQLAIGWLGAIAVDVPELEKTNKVQVQRQLWSSGGGEFLSPLFEARWGNWDEPKVRVLVDGKGKKFIQLKQNDTSFSRRPAELIKNVDELLAISDERFQKYSPAERSNLIARFAVNWPFSPQTAVTNRAPPIAPSSSPPTK